MPLPDLLDGVTLPDDIDAGAAQAAAARIRAACSWHIAPEFVQTWAMPVPTDGIVDLDTLRLVSVSQVTIDGETLDPDAYDWSEQGRVIIRQGNRRGRGLRSLVITAAHGYEKCPADLVNLVAKLAAPGLGGMPVRSEDTGPFKTSYFVADQGDDLAPYRIPVVA